ncbi:MAG: amidase [Gammaproteobacteria bacterium]|nr:amidase [Gammaproteobacteria bacterium]
MTATGSKSSTDAEIYQRQGFGARLGLRGRIGLLIVDFVVGFKDPSAFGGKDIAAAIDATTKVLTEARRRHWPVAHTRIVFADDASDANVFCLKVPTLRGLTENAATSAIVPELAPGVGELVVRKTLPSAFFNTGLCSWLVQRQVETLLIAGATTSGCVRASVVDAMSCGFRPIVLVDCVGDRSSAPHEASLFDMQQKYADVMPFSEVVADLAADSAQSTLQVHFSST